MANKSTPLIAIDLVRFSCAAMVMLHHYFTTFWINPSGPTEALLRNVSAPSLVLRDAMRFNWIGVELFFVISGMVIAASAEGSAPADFLKRRVLRLLPAAIICASMTAIALAVSGNAGPDLFSRWAASATLWPFAPQIDPSYWTLGIELLFYLAVSAALCFSRTGAGNLPGLLLALSTGFWTFVLAADHAMGLGYFEIYWALTLLPHACLFALGMTLAAAAKNGWTPRRRIEAGIALCLCSLEIVRYASQRALVFDMPAAPAVPLAIFLAGTAILAATWRLQPHLARYIRADIARTIGIATYPLYLIHQEFGAVVMSGWVAPGLNTSVAAPATVLVSAALACAIAAWLEPVVRRVLRAALERGQAMPSAIAG